MELSTPAVTLGIISVPFTTLPLSAVRGRSGSPLNHVTAGAGSPSTVQLRSRDDAGDVYVVCGVTTKEGGRPGTESEGRL